MKKYTFIFIIILCLIISLTWYYVNNKDVEVNDILTAIDEVQISTIPIPFNGSILTASNNTYWLAVRENINNYTDNYRSQLAIAILNPDFSTAKLTVLDLDKSYPFKTYFPSAAQDPRLFDVGAKTYMIFNDAVTQDRLRQMYIADLNFNADQFKLNNLSLMHYAAAPDLVQKNWVPFEFNNELYLIYSFDPYIILKWDPSKKVLTKEFESITNIHDVWKHGEIRGGTPATYVKELDGYLGFFHSSVEYKSGEPSWKERKSPRWRKYYMGAYVIDAKPPFTIKAFTPMPITYPGQYAKDQNYYVIFPAGFVEQKDKFIISAGIDDNKTILLSTRKKDLYAALNIK